MGLEKRGLSGTAITIIMVLVVLVAVILVYNFAVKKEKVSEPDSITFQCASACDSGQKVAFCDVDRTFGNGLMATCYELATNSQYSQYGVQTCLGISCTTQQQNAQSQTCTGLGGEWVTPTTQNTCPSQEGKLVRKRTPSDNPPTAGQICCYYYQ